MVSNGRPVIGGPFLDLLASGCERDGLTLGEQVRVIGIASGTERKGIGRGLSMQMLLAELHVIEWVRALSSAPWLTTRALGNGRTLNDACNRCQQHQPKHSNATHSLALIHIHVAGLL